jgi:hypothetical protein
VLADQLVKPLVEGLPPLALARAGQLVHLPVQGGGLRRELSQESLM